MKEGLIKDTYELVIKEIQSIISISYIVMVGIGMLFNYYKYSAFGINIFQYADIFDFLIAPFEDVMIFVFSILTLLIILLLFVFDVFFKRNFPRSYSIVNFRIDQKSWFETYRLISFITIFFAYLFFAARVYGDRSIGWVNEQNDVHLIYADDEKKSGKMIGKTKEVLFLLEKENVKIIPLTSLVKEIQL